ncbi:4Fe-4S ferredoxin [hot springs metagenome]|uniref:4Fe-4S ferredoxin n=1 Tax=hot springs metagenome TaxID=433727 RepID=A0A5J4L3Y1_9ZZZZ
MKMRSWRWIIEIIQAIIIIGLPFVKIKGESALRFDIPSLRLHVFGCTIWMQEFFIVLVATIFFTLLIVFITLVFGRIWCGWLCPQTVIVDFTSFVDRANKKGFMYKLMVFSLTLLISIVVAASLIWYFISPYEFIPNLINGNLGATTWGFWIVLTIIVFLNYAFLRHRWCASVCPYAKLQGVMFDKDTLIIELDPKRTDECIDCQSCVRVCPTGVDIRKGLNAACINCAECIDACNRVMTRFNKTGLIHYAFGTGGEGKVFRQNFFVVGGFVVLFFVFYVYLMLTRTGLDVAVLPHSMEPRITKDERVINAYVLSLKNMRNDSLDLNVIVERFDDTLVQSITEPIHLESGKMDRFPLFVRVNKTADLKSKKIKITLTDKSKDIQVTKEANFVIPDEI